MPSAAAKSGPIGITITKSRMLTNWTAATSSTTARSCLSGCCSMRPFRCRPQGLGSERGQAHSITADGAGSGVAGDPDEVGAGGEQAALEVRVVAGAAVVVVGDLAVRRIVEADVRVAARRAGRLDGDVGGRGELEDEVVGVARGLDVVKLGLAERDRAGLREGVVGLVDVGRADAAVGRSAVG